ncbi:MAG: DUF4835 family protein [Chlorobi bacterium]|nr:DUF4835 family protein [Chlorobiota bacterium]
MPVRRILTVILLFFSVISFSQELRCNVQVVSRSIQGTNKSIFETLQKALTEFMNNTTWTNEVYAPEERIVCNILINLKEAISADEFRGTIQIQASRPVYNASYKTVTLNRLDQDFQFTYVEDQPLVYNPNTFSSNLVAVMAYYAYMIIGIDHDTFSLNGGTPFYQKAENIVNRAQNAKEPGWKSFENKKNRYWLTENILNQYHRPLRKCLYEYHIKGLDIMSDKPQEGRSNIYSALEGLRKVQNQDPGSAAMTMFFDAKSDELVNIFSGAFPIEKGKAASLLKEIDPSNIKKYEKITSGP